MPSVQFAYSHVLERSKSDTQLAMRTTVFFINAFYIHACNMKQLRQVNEAENVDEKDEHHKVSEESLGSPSYAENLHLKGKIYKAIPFIDMIRSVQHKTAAQCVL